MERIVIIGSSGAGKSTLARELGSKLGTKVFHLDRFFWQLGWKKETGDTRIDLLQNLVREKRWIIEGSYLNTSELHLNKADTIIFLDIFPLLCLYRIIKRHCEYRGRSRRDIPKGCTDRLTLSRMLRVLAFSFQGRRTIEQKLRTYQSKQIIWLRSSKEVEDFLAQQEQGLNEVANRFAYRAQVLRRMVLWRQRRFGQYFFSLFLDLLAGYGYKPIRSFISYVFVIGIFMLMYHVVGITSTSHLKWREALVISMTAFHGRGFFPDQFKPGDPQAMIAAIEALVGLIIEVSFIATLTKRLFGNW